MRRNILEFFSRIIGYFPRTGEYLEMHKIKDFYVKIYVLSAFERSPKLFMKGGGGGSVNDYGNQKGGGGVAI